MEESNLEQNPNIQPQNNTPQAQQPVQPVENQAQVSKPASKSKLPLILIIIFVLLVILASGAYYYLGLQTKNVNKKEQTSVVPTITQNSPTPVDDETASPDLIGANWKTYTDSTYNYSIKYPNDWILVRGKDFDGYPNIKITNNSQKNVNGSTELYISIGGPYSTSGAVCANSICKEAKKVNVNIENKNYVFPILQSAVFYTFTFEINNKEINTPIINNLPSYSTYLSATSTYKSLEEEKIILDILSTFKFTDQNQTKDISNWKTYTSTKYNYSFKYPSDNMEVIECTPENVYPVMKDRHFDPCQSGAASTIFAILIINEDMSSKLPDWYYRDYNIIKSNTFIDGKIATKFTGVKSSNRPAPIPPTISIITLIYKGKSIFINNSANDNQILSTFRFAN